MPTREAIHQHRREKLRRRQEGKKLRRRQRLTSAWRKHVCAKPRHICTPRKDRKVVMDGGTTRNPVKNLQAAMLALAATGLASGAHA